MLKIGSDVLETLEEYKRNPIGFYERALVKSIWDVEHWRAGELLDKTKSQNTVTAEGINQILRTMFTGGTQIALLNWYVLIFNTNTTPDDGTTYAVPVFTEETEYDSLTRPLWEGGAVAGKEVTSSANKASFIFNGTSDGNTMYGGALVGGTGADVKGDAAAPAARMYSAAPFDSSRLVEDDDTLKVTITLTGADV